MIANVSATTTAPIYSVLDLRHQSSPVITNEMTNRGSLVEKLWHGDIGYIMPINNASTTQKSGNWARIRTSTQPPGTVDFFAAWLQRTSATIPVSYTAFPGTDQTKLQLQSVRNDTQISAIFEEGHNTAMVMFRDGSGETTAFIPPRKNLHYCLNERKLSHHLQARLWRTETIQSLAHENTYFVLADNV